ISSGGSTYSSDLSYWEQLNGGLYNSPLIERLENEYRGFMRGKNVHGNLYKDGDFLAYADISYDFSSMEARGFTFDIAVWDKNADQETSFEYQMPIDKNLEFVWIEDVQ